MNYKEKFVQEISELVVKYPSSFFNSVSIAQACLETGFGTSRIYREANNAFGYKAKAGEWDGSTYSIESPEEENGRTVLVRSRFRRYDSVEDSVKDHANLMTRTPAYAEIYKRAIKASYPDEQARALSGSYATDSKYGQKLIQIMDDYDLRRYDKGDNMKPKIIDRRTQALGYPGHGVYPKRPLTNIKYIVWHYTASTNSGYGGDIIERHENWWRDGRGWEIGGYNYYIDRQGNIFWNYDLSVVTYGAGAVNPRAMHISLEASSKSNYTPAQLQAREDLTVWLLKEPLNHLGANAVKQHKDFMSTTCAGYTESDMVSYRSHISTLLDADWGSQSNTPDSIEPSKNGKYTVKHGDTLWAIAQANNVTVDELREWNGIAKGQWLKTGQVLYVTEPKKDSYTVVKGDSLWAIGQKFDVTVDEIKKWNNLESNIIYTGQELHVTEPEVIDPESEVTVPEEAEIVEEIETEEAVELEEGQFILNGVVYQVSEVK